MDDIRNVSKNERNFLERILYNLPLFKGYLERENRRESDRILREYIVEKLLKLKENLLSLSDKFLKKYGLESLNEINSLINEIEALKNKIEFAPHGYSSFFDTTKIDTSHLDKIYEMDSEILNYLNQVTIKGEQLDQMLEREDGSALLKNILVDVKNMVSKFDERNNFIKGIR